MARQQLILRHDIAPIRLSFINDSNGWVKVRRKMIDVLGVVNKISKGSRQSDAGRSVYLNHRDAHTVLGALVKAGRHYVLDTITPDQDRVQSYARFQA